MKRKKGGFFLKFATVVFAVYSLYTLISLQIEINGKEVIKEELKGKIADQQLVNAQHRSILEDELSDEYIERIARDKLGLAYPNERVFINPDAGK